MIKKLFIVFTFIFIITSAVGFAVYQGVFNINKIRINISDSYDEFNRDALIKSGEKKLSQVKG